MTAGDIIAAIALVLGVVNIIMRWRDTRSAAKSKLPDLRISQLFFTAADSAVKRWDQIDDSTRADMRSHLGKTGQWSHDNESHFLISVARPADDIAQCMLLLNPLKIELWCDTAVEDLLILDTYAIVSGINMCANAITPGESVSLRWAWRDSDKQFFYLSLAYFCSLGMTGLNIEKYKDQMEDVDFLHGSGRQRFREVSMFSDTAYLVKAVFSDGTSAYYVIGLSFDLYAPILTNPKFMSESDARNVFGEKLKKALS